MSSGAAAPVLVASGLGDDTGGGVYVLEPTGGVVALDDLSTVGIAVSEDGSRLARLLWTDDDPQTSGELLLYDGRGVVGYRRLDALQEPHGAVWHRGRLVVVSTLANGILWLDAHGTPVREWRAPGDGDCWHLNSVAVWRDRLVASAFGRFDGHRGWMRPGARDGGGTVFDVETGDDLATGLSAPHDPLPFEDGLLVCNSGGRELLRLAEDGRVVRRVPLGGWTRGLAVDEHRVYVGVSAHRLLGAEGRARVVALDRATFRELRSWALPCREVFSLALTPPPLVAGLRTGFATNPYRLRESGRIEHGTPAAAPLDRPDRRVRVSVSSAPPSATAGSWLTLRYRLDNEGGTTLASGGEHSVVVGAFWQCDGGEVAGLSGRARLPSIVGPGGSAEGLLRVPAPDEPGGYRLRVAVGQEGLGWLDVGNGGFAPWEATVDVVASP
jgi:acetolactate synthase I/II/III large subunit